MARHMQEVLGLNSGRVLLHLICVHVSGQQPPYLHDLRILQTQIEKMHQVTLNKSEETNCSASMALLYLVCDIIQLMP